MGDFQVPAVCLWGCKAVKSIVLKNGSYSFCSWLTASSFLYVFLLKKKVMRFMRESNKLLHGGTHQKGGLSSQIANKHINH